VTVINPSLPSGYTIFCDDIRHEASGKATYVGIYKSVMFLRGEMPVTLPKICFAILLREEPQSKEPVTIKIFFPGQGDEDEPGASIGMQLQNVPETPPSSEFTMRDAWMLLEVPNAKIEQYGKFRVRAYRGGDEIRLGTLVVQPFPDENETATKEQATRIDGPTSPS
jgi:hypothetical protein